MLPDHIQQQLNRLIRITELIQAKYGELERDLLLQEVRNLYLALLNDSQTEGNELHSNNAIPNLSSTSEEKENSIPEQDISSKNPSLNQKQQAQEFTKKEEIKPQAQDESKTFKQFQPKQENKQPNNSVWENLGQASTQQEQPTVNQSVSSSPKTPNNQSKNNKPIASLIALADRYYLQRELFQNNTTKMQEVLNSIDNASQIEEAKEIIQPLKSSAMSNQAFERINELVELKYQ